LAGFDLTPEDIAILRGAPLVLRAVSHPDMSAAYGVAEAGATAVGRR
jgi:hypothetical protein